MKQNQQQESDGATPLLPPTSDVVNPDDVQELYTQVRAIVTAARAQAVRSVNVHMVQAYWKIGQAIVEFEQQGRPRADYGTGLIESLAQKLAAEVGTGFQARNLWWMRDFYQSFPNLNALRTELSWTHYRLLLKVDNSHARAFYEQESATQHWSTRELERQITSLYYERAAVSASQETVLSQAHVQAEHYTPQDFIKDPYVLEFLKLKESSALSEADLETALLDHLQEFLLELGKGFAFVSRQQRLTIDGDHFYVDLVFYNRLLRCFVLVDLKVGKLTHQDLGQMQLYVNYYTLEIKEEWENPTLGILLCADKNDAVVNYTLPQGDQQIFASRYRLQLPSEEELVAELRREQELLSFQQRLEAEPHSEQQNNEADAEI